LYIGTIPTPAATESRQEFTCTAGQTTFNTTGGTTGYIDCFLNGVKLDSRSDFSFDGSVVTLTTGAAAGDILAVIMRQADNALVALPITDSAGNNVLSESGGVVSIDSGVQFPAGVQIGHKWHTKNTIQNISKASANTYDIITWDVNSTTSIVANQTNSIYELTANVSFGITDGAFPIFIFEYSTNGTNYTRILGPTDGSSTPATFGGQYGGGNDSAESERLFNVGMSWVFSPNVSAGNTFYYRLLGTNRGAGSTGSTLKINATWGSSDANRSTGVSSLICKEISA